MKWVSPSHIEQNCFKSLSEESVKADQVLNFAFGGRSIICVSSHKLYTMKSKFLFSAMFLIFLAIANFSFAQDGSFAKNHPRRTEVNQRLHNQNHRINHKFKKGDISRHQAYRMHQRDHRIRMEERRMAFRHNGHISRHQQYRLNRQEDRLSHRIRKV
jgi:hypothetical protein